MRRIDKLGQAQRAIVVAAIGVAFLAAGSYIQSLGQGHFKPGWYGDTSATFRVPRIGQWPGWVHPIIWLVLACLWAGVSIRLLRRSRHDAS